MSEQKDQQKKKAKKPSKALKAAIKEGGKKGQDIEGINALGGMSFFCVALEKSGGKLDFVMETLQAMNKDIDPNGDDRKGGSKHLAKLLLSFNDDQLVLVMYVPDALHETLTAKEWMEYTVKNLGCGEPVEEFTNGLARVLCKTDADKNQFPMKLHDTAISHANAILQQKNLLPEDSDDEDDYNYAADFDW